MKYYTILNSDESVAESGDETLNVRFTEQEIRSWQAPKFELTEGIRTDYLGNDAGWRICSAKLRKLIDLAVDDRVRLVWLPVEVDCKSAGSETFFALRIEQSENVLHASSYRGENVVVFVLAAERVAGRTVFTCYPDEDTQVYVADTVKLAIEEAHCTGMEFSELPVRVSN